MAADKIRYTKYTQKYKDKKQKCTIKWEISRSRHTIQ